MSTLHSTLLYLHIALAAVALLLFWLPLIARKGSKFHIKVGKLFYYLMLTIAGSGIIMSALGLYDPVGIYASGRGLSIEQIKRMMVWRVPMSQLLLLLSMLTWVTVRHAIGVLHAKANRSLLRNWRFQGPVLLLIPTALYVAYQGVRVGMPLLLIFSIVSLISAITICLYVYKAEVKPRAWIIEHFSAMVGAGIALYTAFFAAGGRRVLAQWLPSDWQLVSWLVAPVIGISAMILLTGYYKRRYKVEQNALNNGINDIHTRTEIND